MGRILPLRVVYIRITGEDGKRKYQEIGTINRKGEFKWSRPDLLDSKGMPLTGIFEV